MVAGIIDTHIHVWNFEHASYDWLKHDTSILHRSYDIAELEHDRVEAGITGGMLIQAANNFEDTDWMLEVANKTGWISGVVGWLPLTDPVAMEKVLKEKYLANKYFKGIRHLIHDEPDPKWLLQENVIKSLQILADHHLSYDFVGITTEHIQTALTVSQRVPELKMIFDHLNRPPEASKKEFDEWKRLMKKAAKHKNFFAKISGLGKLPTDLEKWNSDYIKPHISFALEAFGEDRCMCGGNWPVSLLKENYVTIWQTYKSIINSLLNDEGKEKLFYKNALQFYNL
jgi:L-fuconolactonase